MHTLNFLKRRLYCTCIYLALPPWSDYLRIPRHPPAFKIPFPNATQILFASVTNSVRLTHRLKYTKVQSLWLYHRSQSASINLNFPTYYLISHCYVCLDTHYYPEFIYIISSAERGGVGDAAIVDDC